MWILPNNHPLSSAFAQGYVESNEDLKEYFEKSEPPLFWKSKPLSWKTFLLQWKRVWWLRHLSGRILKPSTRSLFEESLTELLVATLVSPSRWPETEEERTTQGTSGLSFDDTLRSYNRGGVFSRMLQDTLHSDSMSSSANWKKWVTGLRLESTQRRKSARLIAESDSSSLPLGWPTPDCSDRRSAKSLQQGLSNKVKEWNTWPTPQNRDYRSPDLEGSGNLERKLEKGWTVDLNSAVLLNWPTPTTQEVPHPTAELTPTGRRLTSDKKNSHSLNLTDTVLLNWPTPVAHETRLGYQDRTNGKKGSQESLTTTVLNTDFPQVKEYISTNGKSPARLNPAWSIQLMGTTLQRIFTVPLVIPLLSKPQNSPSETSSEKCTTGSDLLIEDWLNS